MNQKEALAVKRRRPYYALSEASWEEAESPESLPADPGVFAVVQEDRRTIVCFATGVGVNLRQEWSLHTHAQWMWPKKAHLGNLRIKFKRLPQELCGFSAELTEQLELYRQKVVEMIELQA